MSKAEQSRMVQLLDRLATSMESQAQAFREFGDELRAFRRDIEKLDRRVTKLEGKRRGK